MAQNTSADEMKQDLTPNVETQKSPKKCCLCSKGTECEQLKLFNENNLRKCIESEKIKIWCSSNLPNCSVKVDSSVHLPPEVNNDSFYHSLCYRRFTAVNKFYRDAYNNRSSECTVETPKPEDQPTQSYDEPMNDNTDEGSESNVNVCIICCRRFRRRRGRLQCLSSTKKYNAFVTIKSHAIMLDVTDFVVSLENAEVNNKSILYHAACKQEYKHYFDARVNKKNNTWHKKRLARKNAFKKLCTFIKDNVIDAKKSYHIAFLQEMLNDLTRQCYKHVDLNVEENIYVPSVKDKIFKVKPFTGKIKVLQIQSKLVLAPSSVTDINMEDCTDRELFDKCAYRLRDIIKKMKVTKLPDNIHASDVIKGECDDIPELVDFFQKILTGCNSRRKKSPSAEQRASTLAADTVFAVHRGKVLSSKHISLAIVVKSMSGNKNLLALMNKFGYTINYCKLLEIETQLAETSLRRSTLCPENISRTSNLRTGVSFDNFDRFVETLDGKQTLHDTQFIIYQDDCGQNALLQEQVEQEVTVATHSRKRRSLKDSIVPDVPPYPKRIKVLQMLQKHCVGIPPKLNEYRNIDAAWVISLALGIKTPMWVGYNAQLYNDSSTTQIVSYLPPINESPTNTNVVVECLKRCVKIADECGQEYIEVTSDLAIAKIVFRILSTEERDKKDWHIFKRIFPHMGILHIEFSLLKAIGTFIADSGLTNVLVDCNLLGAGAVVGFLKAKNFNRAKRLHVLIAGALSKMHFDFFIETEKIAISNNIKQYLKTLQMHGFINEKIDNEELLELIEKYLEFRCETEAGEHGKTAQFYMNYVKYVNYYLLLERSVRMGDFDLFLYILPTLSTLFFAFNHHNYARWLPYYHQCLVNVETTHPGLEKNLRAGSFGVKRTSKPFSRPIDLVTEQTVNKDAGRKTSGLTYLTNAAGARMRWAINHCIISFVTRNLLEKSGIYKTSEVTNDLSNSRMSKNLAGIKDFEAGTTARMKPFDQTLNQDCLYNISTGQSAPLEVTEFLLSVESIGQQKQEKFISECSEDINKFDTISLKKVAVQNFTTTVKKRVTSVKTNVKTLKVQNNLFGQLLRIALENDVDMTKVLTYPLFEVPLSLCHIDGTMNKTDKSALTQQLEKSIEHHVTPDRVDIQLYDGFALFYEMKTIPLTFGNLSLSFLKKICVTEAKEIHLIFDTYRTPSIKSSEHKLRDTFSVEYDIRGTEQERPSNFFRELRNSMFKENLVRFFMQHWATSDIKEIIKDKILYVNFELCYKFTVENENVTRTVENSLTCTAHEEADTKIVFHVCNILTENANVVLRCTDTDVVVIMLANMFNASTHLNVWMDYGTGNNRRFIHITKIYQTLGVDACRGLAGLHAFTGCDYMPCFYRKGKKQPLKIYLNNKDFQQAFIKMADETEENFPDIEKFTCSMYGFKSGISINECRYAVFMKATANEKREAVLDSASNVDATSFPPSQIELKYQILRARYISSIWSNCHKKQPSLLTPEGNGWILQNDTYSCQWYSGDMVPQDVAEIVVEPENETSNDNDLTTDEEDEEKKEDDKMNDELLDYVSDDESDDDSSYEMDSEYEMTESEPE